MTFSRTSLLHCARVYLAQSRHFTGRARGFSFTLLQWAARCRREAMACEQERAVQGELF